jgi:hypothetical protein
VPITTTAEMIPDAAPAQRKREEDGPAIIKPLSNEDYLPALITIIHTIPLYRNSLLAPEIQRNDYKVGDDWWKGTAPSQGRTLDSQTTKETENHLEILHETQRLMAFLDCTDRAYGSVGNLLQLEAWKEPREPMDRDGDELLKFLEVWGAAYQNQTSRPLNGVLRSMVRAAGQNQESYLLDAVVTQAEIGTEKTLYDVLDDVFFETSFGNAHIVDASTVVILRLTNSRTEASSLGCKIPAVLYVDRYMEENKEIVDKMLQDMDQYRRRISELDSEIATRKYYKTKKVRAGERVETLKLLKSSMVAFQPSPNDLIEDPTNTAVLSQLQTLYGRIEDQLNSMFLTMAFGIYLLTGHSPRRAKEGGPNDPRHHFL